jgi:hypothetical protein
MDGGSSDCERRTLRLYPNRPEPISTLPSAPQSTLLDPDRITGADHAAATDGTDVGLIMLGCGSKNSQIFREIASARKSSTNNGACRAQSSVEILNFEP